MKTPICDFIERYSESDVLRLHIPGHKGVSLTGAETFDITEISGADSLYEADGIIAQSENIASKLFHAKTFYSTEGSSLAIRAMLLLAVKHARERGQAPHILAGRNAHKVFLSAAALLDFEVSWIFTESESYLRCTPSAEYVDELLSRSDKKPTAVYLTSPDYLGNIADVRGISEVCHKHGALLLVDNAHGAYLKFLPKSAHPIDLGADACADSAHKTLPALTGAAYLHVSHSAPKSLAIGARQALATFGSTSPSYLILRSLDATNAYIGASYKQELRDFTERVRQCKTALENMGFELLGDEPLKLTVCPLDYGYTGTELAEYLRSVKMECEFADRDVTVMMLTPQSGTRALNAIQAALGALARRKPIVRNILNSHLPEKVTDIRTAMLSPCQTVPVTEAVGRVLATPSVSCPPAVPLIVCGERIDEQTLKAFEYYGIRECSVIKE